MISYDYEEMPRSGNLYTNTCMIKDSNIVWYYSNDTGNLYTNTCMIKDSNIVWYYSNDTGNLYTNTCMIKVCGWIYGV
jgi:glucan-binding YG repeat protein